MEALVSEEYQCQQWPVAPSKTYIKGRPETLRRGDVYESKRGVLRMYWEPIGGNYTESEKESLAGFYDVPYIGEVEEMVHGDCMTPAEDYVEPDHPDSWMMLLGII